MMQLNGFTLGFFFPKQAELAPRDERASAKARNIVRREDEDRYEAEHVVTQHAALPLYAYRFF
jgi:hypothetical protein